MSRPPADIRISLKRRGGKTYRIELVRDPFLQRFSIRRDGKLSVKLPEATATQIAEQIRRWLVSSSKHIDRAALEPSFLPDLPIQLAEDDFARP